MKKLLSIAIVGLLALSGVVSCKKESHYIVTFDSTGGSAVARQVVVEGGHATRPANPTRAGYAFQNWYHDKATTRVFDFTGFAINAYVTVYAGWAPEGGTTHAALNSLIAEVEALKAADYSASSWANLQAALAVAKVATSTSGVTEGQLAEATATLQTAKSALVYTGGLAAAIKAVKALPAGAYTADSWAAVKNALDNAESVVGNSSATAQQVTDALTALNTAVGSLALNTATGGQTTVADKGALGSSITNAESKVQSEYTPATWTTMQNSLADAKKVRDDPAASQAQVDAAKAALDRDVAALQHVTTSAATPTGGADKSSLNSFIADSEKLVEANYTADSWQLFQTALTNAKTVRDNTSATQAQVETAYADLERAVNNLALQQTNTGVVSGLVNQLTTLVNSLPTSEALQVPIVGPLLAETTKPVATLADTVRDQLLQLVGTNNTQVNTLSNTLNGVLNAVGLTNLI